MPAVQAEAQSQHLPLARGAGRLGQKLSDVHRQTNRAALIRDRSRDRLTDPPVHVRAEAEAAPPVVFLDADLQADVAFLDEVEEGQPAPEVASSDRDDEAQVALDQSTASALAILGLVLQLEATRRLERLVGGRQLAQSRLTTFETLRQRHLF